MSLKIPGNIDDEDSLVSLHQQKHLQQICALVVEQILPPMAHDQFGHKHGDLAVLVGLLLLRMKSITGARTKR